MIRQEFRGPGASEMFNQAKAEAHAQWLKQMLRSDAEVWS